jgi:hypothetical protein
MVGQLLTWMGPRLQRSASLEVSKGTSLAYKLIKLGLVAVLLLKLRRRCENCLSGSSDPSSRTRACTEVLFYADPVESWLPSRPAAPPAHGLRVIRLCVEAGAQRADKEQLRHKHRACRLGGIGLEHSILGAEGRDVQYSVYRLERPQIQMHLLVAEAQRRKTVG